MGDSLNIENLLHTGYFTTSRAKRPNSPNKQQDPASIEPRAPRSEPRRSSPVRIDQFVLKSRPPPPTVEDEEVSLAREYGTSTKSAPSEGDPPSRGEVEQQPIFIEVHEHNPERRFVIVNNDAPTKESPAEKVPQPTAQRQSRETKQPSTGGFKETNAVPKEGPNPASKLKPQAGTASDASRPELSRRKSRQDLPPIETKLPSPQRPHHYRTQSATNVDARSSYTPRQSSTFGDELLSPEVIKAGSGRREKTYYDYAPPSSAKPRLDEKKNDREFDRREIKAAAARRPTSYIDPGRPRRRMSNDPSAEARYREDFASSRNTPRSNGLPMSRNADTGRQPASSDRARNNTQMEEPAQPSKAPDASRRRPASVIQEERPAFKSSPDKAADNSWNAKPRAEGPKTTYAASKVSGSDGMPSSPRTSGTWGNLDSDRKGRDRPTSQLPYPDDDDQRSSRLNAPIPPEHGARSRSRHEAASRTERYPATSVQPEPPKKPAASTEGRPKTPKSSQPWQPPLFDPFWNSIGNDKPAGSYRRHSESQDADGAKQLPQCPRTKPVTGLLDWLTLPRTDFVICPTCYMSVFDNSEYRGNFQPFLTPTTRPMVCQFGSSPWYRIAWLLTLKNRSPDLRLLHQTASVINSTKAEPCPGERRTVRDWFVVRDPQSRRTVPDFNVCYQCAKTVETLLPNMSGVLVPDSRSDQTQSQCALHFTPERKQFVLLFDVFETTSDNAYNAKKAPNIEELSRRLTKLSVVKKCREDSPIPNGYWHTMQYLPELTVCGECFSDIVEPRLKEGSMIAKNFYKGQQQLPSATCQLYSDRMREIFKKACRREDPKYLEDKVRERLEIEADIHGKLVELDKYGRNDAWVEEQVDKLIEEWRKWE